MILGVAVLLRFAALGDAPPGLYQDEAVNGLDALRVLEGHTPLYFEANNGREPLYTYLAALSTGLFGSSAFALRLPAALLGVLAVPATYALGRVWFDRRVGLLAAAALAVMLWHVHLSHLAFRAVALPLFTALALAAGTHGLRRGKRWALVMGGACYGLAFYTYLPARFTPIALALIGFCALAWHREMLRAHWRGLVLMAATAAVVVAPLGVLTLQDPGLVFGRSGQVAVWSLHGGDLPGTLARHTLAALGMFGVQGDTIARHNPPGRPVFDLLMAAAWLVGVVLLLAQFRRNLSAPAVVIWLGVMLLPTILAEDAPHFLRAVGVLPVVVLPAAYALSRVRPRGVAFVVLTVALSWTIYDYFGVYLPAQETSLAFDHAATALAADINSSERAVVDWRIWERYPAVEYLTADHPDVQVYYDEGRPAPVVDLPVLLAAWPYEPQSRLIRLLPAHPVSLRVSVGPQAIYDPDAPAFHLYVAYRAAAEPVGEPVVVFENGMDLISARCTPSLTLYWRARERPPAAYTALIHAVDGTAYDAPPGTWAYPTGQWRPGDILVQTVPADKLCSRNPSALTLGLYNGSTGARLPVLVVDEPAIRGDNRTVQLAP